MAITPRSKGLGNIGAIVDRQGRASVDAPVKPKSVSKPAPKPVAKVAPKPAPKLAAKPSPFKPNTRAPGGKPEVIELQPALPLGQSVPSPINRSQIGGKPEVIELQPALPLGQSVPSPINRSQIGGAQRVGGAFDKPIFGGEPGRGPGFITQPMDQFTGQQPMFGEPNMGGFTTIPMDQFTGQQPMFGEPGVGNFTTIPMDQFTGQQPMFGEPGRGGPVIDDMRYKGPDYGGPYMPRPDMGPDVGFGIGLPQPGFDGQQPMFGEPAPYNGGMNTTPGFKTTWQQLGYNSLEEAKAAMDPNMGGATKEMFGEPAPYTGGMMSPRRVINQVGKPGFQPRPTMQSAFSPEGNDFSGDGFMGGSGSMFGGGGFGGR